ncbi:MAG: hypothetical protein Q8L24_00610 [bacterium]|nr:hypothetical protein [bacterium]
MIARFKKVIYWLIPLVLIVGFALFIHSRLTGMADADSFYHIRHAEIYRTSGIFQTAFPWVQYSAIKQYSADLWYGFHILLIPLTFFADLSVGINIGALLITIIASILFFLALLKLKVRWPILWLGVFLLSSADALYRLTMLRPHPLSLGLSMLLFAYLVSRENNKTKWITATIAFALSWNHISLSWMAILIVGVVGAIEIAQRRKLSFQKYIAVGAGLLAGIFLRPNPFGVIQLAYIQVVKLLFEKQGDLPLRFGRELTPFVWENFVDQLIPITLLLIAAAVLLFWLIKSKKWQTLSPEIKTSLITSPILCSIFLFLTFAVARRSNELFISFGVLFIALSFTQLKNLITYLDWYHYTTVAVLCAVIIYMPFKTIYRFDTYMAGTFNTKTFQGVADWLNTNSKPGEIVFNIHWDRFAQLFYWDTKNYFINGMDPIFEYAYDPSLYWKTHFLAIDAGSAYTCGKVRCTAEEVVPTYGVLKNDFHASYIVVEKRRSPKLLDYLRTSPDFQKVFEDIEITLFKIK